MFYTKPHAHTTHKINVFSSVTDELVGELKVVDIGTINNGIDGSDQYLSVTRLDDVATSDLIETWLLPIYYRECSHAGGYFCKTVTATPERYSHNRFIVRVDHRYDV